MTSSLHQSPGADCARPSGLPASARFEPASFDRITRLAAAVFDVAVAATMRFDADVQHHCSALGLDARTADGADAFAVRLLRSADPDADEGEDRTSCAGDPRAVRVVSDASDDPRLSGTRFVEGAPHLRFLAVAPIYDPQGSLYGAVCAADPMPTTPTADRVERLADLAALAEDRLAAAWREREHSLLTVAVEEMSEAVLVTEGAPIDEPGPRIVYANSAVETLTGYRASEVIGETPRILQGPETDRATLDRLRAALENGEAITQEATNYRKDGTAYVVQWSISPVPTGATPSSPDDSASGDGPSGSPAESPPDGPDDVEFWVSIQRDVTPRRRRQQRIEEGKERYETLVANFPNGGVFLFDDDLRYTLAGGSELEKVGLTSSDFEGRRPSDIFEPTLAEELQDHYRAALNGEERVFEQSYQGQHYRIHTLPLEQGGEEGAVGMALSQNVTAQKERERDLLEARKQAETRGEVLQTIFDNAPLMFVVFGPDREILHVNAGLERLFGWTLDEVEDTNALMSDVFPDPKERADAYRFIEAAPNEWRTFRTHRRDGTSVDTRWTFVDLSGGRRIGIGIDVTERQKYERKLREERDRLATLFNSLPTPVVHGIPRGRRFTVQTVNTAFERVFGTTEEELRGQDLHDYIVPTGMEEEAADINRRVLDEPSLQADVRRRAAEGLRDFQVQAAVRTTEDGPEAYAIYTDITEQKKQEQRLREAKQRAEEAAQLKSAMLANMSHEVRTPLTSITGFSEMLTQELEGKPSEFASMIYRNSQRLMQTLDAVLQLSKLDAGAYDLERTQVEIGPLVNETVTMLGPEADDAGVSVYTDLPDAPVVCLADPGAVDGILANLVGNAIKFTDAGGRVDVGVTIDDDHAVLTVEDTGVGISSEFLPYLFEAFKQESEGLHRTYEGAGLGLALTKRLVEAVGGAIDVESEKGVGTCVTVRLPLADAA